MNKRRYLFPLVIPEETIDKLKSLAKQQERSVSNYIRALIAEDISSRLQKSTVNRNEPDPLNPEHLIDWSFLR